mmetsp:Transcript_12251/g.34804  ORF Transcript_12251/g.34804 Transcript_12251/m.34804 type:complete len:311 (-) Transcript_12251:49-981(-)
MDLYTASPSPGDEVDDLGDVPAEPHRLLLRALPRATRATGRHPILILGHEHAPRPIPCPRLGVSHPRLAPRVFQLGLVKHRDIRPLALMPHQQICLHPPHAPAHFFKDRKLPVVHPVDATHGAHVHCLRDPIQRTRGGPIVRRLLHAASTPPFRLDMKRLAVDPGAGVATNARVLVYKDVVAASLPVTRVLDGKRDERVGSFHRRESSEAVVLGTLVVVHQNIVDEVDEHRPFGRTLPRAIANILVVWVHVTRPHNCSIRLFNLRFRCRGVQTQHAVKIIAPGRFQMSGVGGERAPPGWPRRGHGRPCQA